MTNHLLDKSGMPRKLHWSQFKAKSEVFPFLLALCSTSRPMSLSPGLKEKRVLCNRVGIQEKERALGKRETRRKGVGLVCGTVDKTATFGIPKELQLEFEAFHFHRSCLLTHLYCSTRIPATHVGDQNEMQASGFGLAQTWQWSQITEGKKNLFLNLSASFFVAQFFKYINKSFKKKK